ncbi:MAG TPA: hypothetical protein VFY44_12080 [Thermoleophilaceae bacterium]|nr:hypothetical protein [Thermoleophilaceae bacterium]
MRNRLSRPSPALVVASISLFIALGGTGYAAATGSIDGREIKNSTIQGKDVKNSSLTGSDVKTSGLTGSDVKSDSLTGGDIAESSLGKVGTAGRADSATSATSATNAATASNATALGGASPDSYRTVTAQDTRTDNLNLGASDADVLTTQITLPVAKQVMATAVVDLFSDGGDNDNANCNVQMATTEGVRVSQQIMDSGIADVANMGLTQSQALPAGTHTVTVECAEGNVSNTTVDEAALTVWTN